MNTRIQWIDNLKGIGILLVVLGHTSFPFKNYIFWIHMPLFFVLTGIIIIEFFWKNMSQKIG
ncbi:TPA: acyltransferase family protein [Streptococcus suis]|nr:acyltransferase family protein [Streptococcus suis]